MVIAKSVALSEDNTVEVYDNNGTPRYNDSGNLLSVEELVTDFLTANPHFVKATAGGAGSSGAAGGPYEQAFKLLGNAPTGR